MTKKNKTEKKEPPKRNPVTLGKETYIPMSEMIGTFLKGQAAKIYSYLSSPEVETAGIFDVVEFAEKLADLDRFEFQLSRKHRQTLILAALIQRESKRAKDGYVSLAMLKDVFKTDLHGVAQILFDTGLIRFMYVEKTYLKKYRQLWGEKEGDLASNRR